MPGTPAQVREATLADRWVDAGMLRLDLPELEPKHASEARSPHGPLESTRQFALFVWIVLAVTSVVAVATGTGHSASIGKEIEMIADAVKSDTALPPERSRSAGSAAVLLKLRHQLFPTRGAPGGGRRALPLFLFLLPQTLPFHLPP